MSISDEYQAMAEECLRRAGEAKSDNERKGYLDLARTWLIAASPIDCASSFLALPSCYRKY
jgi:hypothetical protein